MARKKQEKNIPKGPIQENIKTIGYCEEMETSYRDYALSVIVARALPDVRDGLKPVQRRVLYSMNELGLKHDKPYKKSARIVGDTMGKYHPHGDSSIYEAMVHMAQGWNYNIPLVDSHGNFGSIEGDGPAAQRYCVTGDTLINTNNGLIKIKDIIKNTTLNSDNDIDIKIKSIDGKINHASKLFNSGEHEVFEVILENGMSIKCTENHPLLVLNKKQKPVWKMISELKEGKICVIDKNFEETLFGTNNNLDEIPQIVQELLKKTNLPQEVLSGSKEYLFEFFSKFEKKFGNYSEDYMYITFNLRQLEMAQQIQIMYHTLFGMLFNLSIKSNCILLEKVNTFSLEKYHTSKIVAINPLGKEVVYSIKVDSDCHSFVGNGFINHNTEARLAQYSEDCLLQDLNKEIVDFVPNFDETETEPSVCPAKVPNILVSGTEGIAVGMATKIPTHNLGEVIDGTIAYIDNEKITTKELMQYIKGPDFATGGIISNKKDLLEMYETGQGKIRIRAKVETEDVSNGKTNIVITEIPYTMIGAIDKFMETVADLVRNKKAPDITDIYNQSGKEGIRIVIELRKNADVQKNINLLYKKARLEDTFGMIMLAVKDQEPIIYSLKGILKEYLEFTLENYRKKYQMLLEKELRNKEIKEGLVKAYDLIDLIIEILRGSKTTKQAKDCLMFGKTDNINFKTKKAEKEASSLNFTELQATAILEMRLQKLIGLEIDLLNKELKECLKNIKTYEGILNSKTKMKNTIKSDLLLFKEKYAKPRKTQIKDEEAIVLAKEELVEQDYVLLMDRFGYIKLIDMPTYERNKESVPNDYKQYINIKNTDKLLVFTNTGIMHSIKALDIPLGKYKDKGVPIDNLSNYNSSKENIIFMCASNDIKDKILLFVNNKGLAKKVEGSNFIVSKKTVDATKLLDGEELLFVKDLNGEEEIILISKLGMFIRFKLEEIPQKGKTASGVRCIKLKDNDIIINAYIGDNKSSFEYQDNQLDFTRIKISKRDGVGTKIRL